MKVTKFGGSSLANGTQLKKVLAIIKSDPERRFIVVSAPGKSHPLDIKVTDLLIDYANAFLAKQETTAIEATIISRFQAMCDELDLTLSMTTIKTEIYSLKKTPLVSSDRVMDLFKSSGENCHARLIAEFLTKNGVPATYVHPKDAGILVEDIPGDTVIKREAYHTIKHLKHHKDVVVIPGFFGVTSNDSICTFSRGGSDVTGSIIAAGINANLYENFTDVDAIYSANPNIIDNCAPITELTFREMRELSYAGFSVLHDEALIPAFHQNIPVVIKNTNNPDAPGTRISASRPLDTQSVIGIAADSGFTSIFLRKYLMNREFGFGFRILEILKEFGLQYEHMPSGIDDITIILRQNQLTPTSEQQLRDKLLTDLKLDEIKIEHDISMVAIVGEGMKNSIGVAAKATTALANEGINLEVINQGASELSILFAIREPYEEQATRALYQVFFD
ncbi:aspartate kinase [Vagococcus sp. DIV0080]|uniref:Aspartokinase n=1 Tax=Candidatus Vagococcus giribetii TaxID=2230876 RepID=A0ABS3HUF8_9ENTE|nr:aspartate kinase [Vagococcus sp. DIV0080]MBO0477388.1 aspartate kinase [Vagococcus sp. DIV0080]